MAAPQDHVLAEHAGDELDDLGVARKIQEGAAASHPFAVVALDVRGYELLRPHAGIQTQQALERLDHRSDLRIR